MKRRWQWILPTLALAWFAWGSFASFRANHRQFPSEKVFYWGSLRLDRDPLHRRIQPPKVDVCATQDTDCVSWEPETIWIEPRKTEEVYFLLSLPAFIAVDILLWALRPSGIDQLYVFMISMPLFVAAWYWFAGWMIDRRRRKLPLAPTQA